MKFEWDSDKSSSNKSKHGIDFDTAKELWLDENRIEIHAPHPVEDRWIVISKLQKKIWIVIGKLQKKIWIAIYTNRNEAIRIISVRRANKKEVELYENEKNG